MDTDEQGRKGATPFTRSANREMASRLPFDDQTAYQDVRRGLIHQVTDLVIGDPEVWSLTDYVDQMAYPPPPDCPDTVNPSLWRLATLNSVAGLFCVVEGVYQVRAYDVSNMTIVETDGGIIVIDPLISTECAQAALALYRTYRPERAGAPVVAVIYTHSHVDHFGGVAGVVSSADVKAGAVEILATACSRNPAGARISTAPALTSALDTTPATPPK